MPEGQQFKFENIVCYIHHLCLREVVTDGLAPIRLSGGQLGQQRLSAKSISAAVFNPRSAVYVPTPTGLLSQMKLIELLSRHCTTSHETMNLCLFLSLSARSLADVSTASLVSLQQT